MTDGAYAYKICIFEIHMYLWFPSLGFNSRFLPKASVSHAEVKKILNHVKHYRVSYKVKFDCNGKEQIPNLSLLGLLKEAWNSELVKSLKKFKIGTDCQ